MNGDEDCAHDDTRAPSRLHDMPFWLLGRASRTAQQVTQQRLAAAGLQKYWYAILATVDEFGPAAQAEIGRRLGVDPSDMVAAVNGLEDEGLVTRTRDPDDRRRNRVGLTRRGRARLASFDRVIHDAQLDYLGELSPAEQHTLVALLQRVALRRPG